MFFKSQTKNSWKKSVKKFFIKSQSKKVVMKKNQSKKFDKKQGKNVRPFNLVKQVIDFLVKKSLKLVEKVGKKRAKQKVWVEKSKQK